MFFSLSCLEIVGLEPFRWGLSGRYSLLHARRPMTEWVRFFRQVKLDIEKQRGCPFLLAARVPDNVLGARIDGLDLETRAQQNLVDIFVPGTRYLDIDFDGCRRISSGTPIKICSCLDAHHSSDAYQNPTMEVLRGVITN